MLPVTLLFSLWALFHRIYCMCGICTLLIYRDVSVIHTLWITQRSVSLLLVLSHFAHGHVSVLFLRTLYVSTYFFPLLTLSPCRVLDYWLTDLQQSTGIVLALSLTPNFISQASLNKVRLLTSWLLYPWSDLMTHQAKYADGQRRGIPRKHVTQCWK